jgi:hypothetical protein
MSVSGRPPEGDPRGALARPRSLSTHARRAPAVAAGAQRLSPARARPGVGAGRDQPGQLSPLLPGQPVTTSRASSARPGGRPARADPAAAPDRSLPRRALDTALRMARTENATLVPVRLERIPLHHRWTLRPVATWRKRSPVRRARELGVHVDPRSARPQLPPRAPPHAHNRAIRPRRPRHGPKTRVEFTAADVAGWSTTPMEDRGRGNGRPRRPRWGAFSYSA